MLTVVRSLLFVLALLAVAGTASAQEIPPENVIPTGAIGDVSRSLIHSTLTGKPAGNYSICASDSCTRVHWDGKGAFDILGVNYFGATGFVPRDPNSLFYNKHADGYSSSGVCTPQALLIGCGWVKLLLPEQVAISMLWSTPWEKQQLA
jgi:hypothetical protein